MKSLTGLFTVLLALQGLGCRAAPPSPLAPTVSPSPTAVPTPTRAPAPVTIRAPLTCAPTFDDGPSSSYQPDAPLRTVVGHGHVVTGTVRSSADCAPIPNAKLEFWAETPGLGHLPDDRATFFTAAAGAYRFECDPTDHIHMRISAEGYQTLASNAYHPEGRATGTFDIVLVPTAP